MTDLIVTAENTKLIAEWMNYKPVLSELNELFTFNGGLAVREAKEFMIAFNLITNVEQSRKVEKRLLNLGWIIESSFEHGGYNIKLRGYNNGVFYTERIIKEKSLSLAIYKAALCEITK